jgi:hypothetical protein
VKVVVNPVSAGRPRSVDQPAMVEAEGVGHVEPRDGEAKVVPEQRFIAERQAAHHRRARSRR